MKLFPDYKTATNAAYQLLADMDSFSLSTNVLAIAEQLPDCKILTYGQASFLYGFPMSLLLGESEYGFSIVRKHQRIILYNESMPISCIRFTIAHEIAHKVLDHKDEEDPAAEKEANCFARNILCPIPVVKRYNLTSALDYVSLFNVSDTMACISWEHRSSDEYYITSDLYSLIDDKVVAYILGFESLDSFYAFMSA